MKLGRLGAMLGAALLVMSVAAGSAAAHATLVESSPAQSAVLSRPPKAVTLTFSEPVDASFGAVRVYDQDSERVDRGGTTSSGRVVTLPLPTLDDGTYVVTWRVVSEDAHPIRGSFAFQVGAAGNATGADVTQLVRDLAAREGGGGALIGSLFGVARWTVFAGLALLIGTVAFLLVSWPAGRASRRAMRLAWIGWWATALGSAFGIKVYGSYASGLGVGDIFDVSLLGETLENRLGIVWMARIAVLVAVVPLLRALRSDEAGDRTPLPRWWLPGAVLAAAALASSPGLSGHAVSGDWTGFAVLSDTLHVLAMAVWLGGLAVLAVAFLPTQSVDVAKRVLRTWSRVAVVCVLALVVTGAFQSWRQVGSLDALRDTEFGKILIVKLVVFAAMLLLAAFSREVVLRLNAPPEPVDATPALVSGGSDDDVTPSAVDDDDFDEAEYEQYELRRLRRTVWGEALVGVAILVVTALLVNAVPAKTAAGGTNSGATAVTLKSDQVWVSIVVAPGRRGANDVHVSTLEPDGAVKDVVDLTMTISRRDERITIDVPLRDLGPGHYLSPGLTIPIAGTWTITARAVVTEFDQVALRGAVEIRGA